MNIDKKAKLISAYKWFINSEDGRVILKDLLAISGFTVSTYTLANDPLSLAFKEGRRSIVLDILKRINMDDLKLVDVINQLKQPKEDTTNDGTNQ